MPFDALSFAAHLAGLWAAIWVANVALYFACGWAIMRYAAKHPDRKIQDRRDGQQRVRAEIRESLRSIAITAFCMALAIALSLFGLTLWSPLPGWWGVIAGAAIVILGYDLYYYWAHRLLHTKRFKRFHRWHHQSLAPTAWSADSQSPAETFIIQSFMVWAAILLPIPPLAFVLHRLYDHVSAQLGHCGYEFFADRSTRAPSPMVCTTFHDQHHELYNFNYGNYFSLWDRVHGTLHPDYDKLVDKWSAKPVEQTPAEQDMYELGVLLGLWAAVYAATVALYFAQGGILVWINNRHPDRRIQKKRRGEDRARIEIIQSLKSLVVTCGCLAGGLWLQWMGWTLWAPLELTWWSAILMFGVSIVLYDAWFYWGHRLMHWRPLYKHHFWHHKSVAPTVWSNYSDTLTDAFAMQSYYLVAPIFLPIPSLVLVAHRLWDHINGQIGHSGFEYFADRTTRFPSPMVCVTFHDQHHEHFNYNFANFFSFWDRVCGTLHPKYDEVVANRGAEANAKATPAE